MWESGKLRVWGRENVKICEESVKKVESVWIEVC